MVVLGRFCIEDLLIIEFGSHFSIMKQKLAALSKSHDKSVTFYNKWHSILATESKMWEFSWLTIA